jgi:hypothetical protein
VIVVARLGRKTSKSRMLMWISSNLEVWCGRRDSNPDGITPKGF